MFMLSKRIDPARSKGTEADLLLSEDFKPDYDC